MATPFDVPDGSDGHDSTMAAGAARCRSDWQRYDLYFDSTNGVGPQGQRLALICRTIVAVNIQRLMRLLAVRDTDADLG